MSQKNKKAPSRSILKSLTYGSGAFLFDSVNAFTPHGSGAVDIMAVRQKDGQIKSSPFYVRFGKYQSFRRNRQVRVKVNGVLMDFHLELGQYGSAFFAHTRDEEILSDGADEAAGGDDDDDDHSLGIMSPVAAYEADYMSLVQGSNQDPPATLSSPQLTLRRPASASASNLPSVESASPPVQASLPSSASLPIRRRGTSGSHVLRCSSGPEPATGAPISASPCTPASPPILAAPEKLGKDRQAGAGLRCGHDWRDLDRSCTPRGDAAVAKGASTAAAGDARREAAAPGSIVEERRVADKGPASLPEIARGASFGSFSGEMLVEDVPDSAAALQNASEREAAAVAAGDGRGANGAAAPGLPPVPRASIDAVHRQLGFEARRAAASAQAVAGDSGPLAERGLVVRLVVDAAEALDTVPHVRVIISPWVRNISLLSAAGLSCIRTSLDRAVSAGKPPGLTGDPSIDFAPTSAVHDLEPMSSFVGAASAAATGAAAAVGPARSAKDRTASEDPSNVTDDSSLDDTSDEDDGVHHRKHDSAPAGMDGAATGATRRRSSGHARHASFQAWAGSYAGLGTGDGEDGEDDEDDVVMASSPHAECMQIGASAMHDEDLRKTMKAAALVEALEATEMQGGGDGAVNDGVGCARETNEVQDEGGRGGTRNSSGDGGGGQGDARPEVELAACAHLLSPDVPPSAVAAAFEEHRVTAADVADRGAAALPLERLAVRINGFVYRYTDAAPLLLSLHVYGGPLKRWQSLIPSESFECPKPQITERKLKRRRTWWASMFWGASSRDVDATAPAAGRTTASLAGASSLDLEESVAAAAATGGGGSSAASLQGADSMLSTAKTAKPPHVKRVRHVRVQSTHPTSAQLQAMAEHLQLGQNTVEFSIGGQRVQSFIHLFNWNIRLVISDIDGTITRSDVLGHVLTPLGVDWTHPGVTRLFSNVSANGYQFVYLSSRSIAQSGITRAFLETLKQQDHGLPAGPVIISPHGIIPSLYREMILKRPEEFKMAALQGIRSLFPDDWNPFYCGFGNRGSDDISYLHVGVPPHRIFTINPAGRVRQLSEPAASGRFDSLSKIDDQVDLLFPVTETARRRLFAAQTSGSARNPVAAAAVAAASAAVAASLAPLPKAATAPELADVDAVAAAAAAATAPAGESGPGGSSEAADGGPPPGLLGTRLVPMESQEAALGLPRLTREGSEHSFDAQVDVDTRDEFNDNNFWKAGISMDSVAAAELEELLAGAP